MDACPWCQLLKKFFLTSQKSKIVVLIFFSALYFFLQITLFIFILSLHYTWILDNWEQFDNYLIAKKHVSHSIVIFCIFYLSLKFVFVIQISPFINRFSKIMRIFYGGTSCSWKTRASLRMLFLGWCAACRYCLLIENIQRLRKKYLIVNDCFGTCY